MWWNEWQRKGGNLRDERPLMYATVLAELEKELVTTLPTVVGNATSSTVNKLCVFDFAATSNVR